MAGYIVNAAPMVIELGTQDLSTRQLPRQLEAVPQHLPKFFLYTRKGPTTPQLVVGAERVNMFGEESFDERGPYGNHATVFSNLVNAEGNAAMIQRVIPKDAGPLANVTLWVDVLETQVDLYERDAFGNIEVDGSGNPVIIGSTSGLKVKWVKTTSALPNTFGQHVPQPGSQVDPVSGNSSTMYPIFEFRATHIGEYSNNCGFRIWPLNTRNVMTPPVGIMTENKAFPYYFQMVRRASPTASAKTVQAVMGDEYLTVTFKQDTTDPTTDKRLYIGETLLESYSNLTDLRYPPVFSDIGALSLYHEQLKYVQELMHSVETPHIDGYSDFTADTSDAWLVNVLTGLTAAGTPYHAIKFVDDATSIRFSEYTNIYMSGGSDGTMNDTLFAELVNEQMDRYLDANDELMENAINVESIIYDSGFPLETKYKLCNFIGQRKDTFVVLSTHDVNGAVLQPSEEHSIAVALRTRLQMFPESDYFGTPVMRGMVMGRSGKLRNSRYTKRLPMSAEVAIKSARFMGAGNGSWKNGFNFDGAPGSVIDSMYDISITWVPTSVRNRNWDVGLNFVLAYDRRSYFFPALKTVYQDDTSVLNSYFTAMAICQLNKIAHQAWRDFSGVSSLTNAQLEQRVNEFILRRVKDRFDNRFVIIPDAHHTDMDVLRGYSITVPIKIYAANMKTVATTFVQAHRISDLVQQ